MRLNLVVVFELVELIGAFNHNLSSFVIEILDNTSNVLIGKESSRFLYPNGLEEEYQIVVIVAIRSAFTCSDRVEDEIEWNACKQIENKRSSKVAFGDLLDVSDGHVVLHHCLTSF